MSLDETIIDNADADGKPDPREAEQVKTIRALWSDVCLDPLRDPGATIKAENYPASADGIVDDLFRSAAERRAAETTIGNTVQTLVDESPDDAQTLVADAATLLDESCTIIDESLASQTLDDAQTLVDDSATLLDEGRTVVDDDATWAKHDSLHRRQDRAGTHSTVFTYKEKGTVFLRRSVLVSENKSVAAAKKTVYGDFLVHNPLGKGGMGIVYNARQSSLNRDVALKMVLPGDKEKRKRAAGKLISEALVTGELDHPNIVPIYELGHSAGGELFYSMKVVRGVPWSASIGAKPEKENIDILLRVADAVAFAHGKKILHRDIKPENVMLGDYGEILVMDWGLAVSLDPRSKAETLDKSNAKAGTPAYMAPEMAMGAVEKIGPGSDIYLLGAVLFEILTGHRPHTGQNALLCLVAAADNRIRETDRDDNLMRVAMRAMATQPADRFATVKEMQAELREVLAHGESILLSDSAFASLRRAEDNSDYEAYTQAIFGFQEATKLWPENAEARRGEGEARYKFVLAAFGKGDYDLAYSSVLKLDGLDARALEQRIRKAKDDVDSRKRRIRTLTVAATVLVLALVVILTGATLIITDRMHREREARELAMEKEKEALAALAETEEARQNERKASEERENALARENRAKEQALAAAREREDALAREKAAQTERLAAMERAELERQQREQAEVAKKAADEELARVGYLEDDSWWVFDARKAAELQAQAEKATGSQATLRLTLADGLAATRFSLIPAGQFVMGSNPRDEMHKPDEYLHPVVLTHPFYIGENEVTRAEWRAIVGMEREEDLMPPFVPGLSSGQQDEGRFRTQQLAEWGWRVHPLDSEEENLPATGVSPQEIETLFLARIRRHAPEGWMLTLPTEAQWEFACRGGRATRFSAGDNLEDFETVGWSQERSNLVLRPVRQLEPNSWNLYDMHGNASEVVLDSYAANYYLASPTDNPANTTVTPYRTLRGGSYIHSYEDCRSASRSAIYVGNKYDVVGFRLALVRETTN